MKNLKWVFKLILCISYLVIMSCTESKSDIFTNDSEVTFKGTLKRNEVSTYQYGTHVLILDSLNNFYALQSSNVNLDDYNNTIVTIKCFEIEGYPIDGGPKLFEVTALEE